MSAPTISLTVTSYSAIAEGSRELPPHACLTLIFARAFRSFDAIRRLCEVASCEDAAVILRSLLNLLAVTRWIKLDPGKRAERFVDWYWVVMHSYARQFKDRLPAESISVIEKYYQAVKSQFEYTDKRNRPRFAKRWYQPEAHSIRELFKKVELEKQYEEGYKPLSGIVIRTPLPIYRCSRRWKKRATRSA